MSLPSVPYMQDVWVRKAFSAAGHTLLVHDYFLTLDDEISYVWNTPWNVVKVMFLINRYGSLLEQTFVRLEEVGLLPQSRSFCRGFTLSTTYSMVLSSALIHVLVFMRAWAIWGTRRRVTNTLIGCYVAYVLLLLAVATYGVKARHSQYKYLSLVRVCAAGIADYVWPFYVASFVLDTVVFVLTMQSLRKFTTEFQFLYPSSLLHLLIRDAIMFFVISLFNDILIIAFSFAYSQSEDPKYFLVFGFASPLLSVAGQHLVLDLRSLKARTYETHDLSREVDRQLEAIGSAALSVERRAEA